MHWHWQAQHPIHQFLATLRDEPTIDFQAIKAAAPVKYQPSSEIIDLSFSSPPASSTLIRVKQLEVPKNVIDLVSPPSLKPTRRKLAHVKSPSPDHVIIFGPPAKCVKNDSEPLSQAILTLPMSRTSKSGPVIVLSDDSDSEIEEIFVKPDPGPGPLAHSKLLLNNNLELSKLISIDDSDSDVKDTPALVNQLGATPQMLRQVLVGSVYNSMEAARDAVYTQEKKLGHIW
jgi:hypothetical protein